MRRFNRFYTRQIGLLDEGMLNSPFSLTQVRTLYELAQCEQTTAVELSNALGLDAGYLSRILTSFEKAGLVEKKQSPEDARHTLLRLTKKGHKAFETLNARSDEQIRQMLGKLQPVKQSSLIQAMGTIESVLSSQDERPAAYVLRQHRPGDMGWVVQRHGELLLAGVSLQHERFEALVAKIASPRSSKTSTPPASIAGSRKRTAKM